MTVVDINFIICIIHLILLNDQIKDQTHRACTMHTEIINAYKSFNEKLQGKDMQGQKGQ
jgi:hypothetical protein